MFLVIPGGYELIAILFVVVLLFGARKIPELAKGVGKGIREFNRAKNSIEEDIRDGIKAEEKKTAEEGK